MIVTIQINSPWEMTSLGVKLGQHFLAPLLQSDDPAMRSLVVAAYGQPSSGKSLFLQAISMGLPAPPFGDLKAGWHHSVEIKGMRFRHADLHDQPYPRGFRQRRDELGMPGMDFLEHPPLSYIDSPGAVIAITSPAMIDFNYNIWLSHKIAHGKTPHKQAIATILNEFLAARDFIEQPYEEGANGPRVVRIGLTSTAAEPLAAFRNFVQNALE